MDVKKQQKSVDEALSPLALVHEQRRKNNLQGAKHTFGSSVFLK